MDSQIKEAFFVNNPLVRCCQGDILRDVRFVVATDFDVETGESDITPVYLKYGVIISQECDLEHDFNAREGTKPNQDKYLPNILILPAYLPDEFKAGKHREEGVLGEMWSSDNFKRIKQNNNARFHFINADTKFQVPELIVDFKHLFTINRNVLYKRLPTVYLATIAELYRESLSHRYSHYMSRIGLPETTGA